MIKKSIRCCISCILPCGALDVIRIVHANGRVEEITGTVRAAEVMRAHPKHVLKKPTSRRCYSDADDVVSPRPTIVVVPPDAELQRGKIYFLIPVVGPTKSGSSEKKKSEKKKRGASVEGGGGGREGNKAVGVRANVVFSGDRYLSEILSEKTITNSGGREKRRGRVGIWRPHLESISETTINESSSSSSSCD